MLHGIDFNDVKIYASAGYVGYARPMVSYGASVVEDIADANMLLLAGGADIGPELYGSPRSVTTWDSPVRDRIELNDVQFALRQNMPIIGTCRGMQLITAVAGGKLVQDVTGHAGPHHIACTPDGDEFVVNSLHHQMCLPHGYVSRFNALAWSGHRQSKHYMFDNDIDIMFDMTKNDIPELEAVFYPDINAFGVQWHPEMMQLDCPATDFYISCVAKQLEGNL